MRLAFEPQAFEDIRYWLQVDRKKLAKSSNLSKMPPDSPFLELENQSPSSISFPGAGHAELIRNTVWFIGRKAIA